MKSFRKFYKERKFWIISNSNMLILNVYCLFLKQFCCIQNFVWQITKWLLILVWVIISLLSVDPWLNHLTFLNLGFPKITMLFLFLVVLKCWFLCEKGSSMICLIHWSTECIWPNYVPSISEMNKGKASPKDNTFILWKFLVKKRNLRRRLANPCLDCLDWYQI